MLPRLPQSNQILLLAFLLLAGILRSGLAETIACRDCNGELRHPFDLAGRKALVLIFISRECPISNSLAPEINRIVMAYTNFSFYLVDADPDTKPQDARKHKRDFELQAPLLLDPGHILVKIAGATMTPQAVALDPQRKILYRGRINDLYAALGKKRPKPTRNDLRDALDAIAAGKPIVQVETEVIGCYIP